MAGQVDPVVPSAAARLYRSALLWGGLIRFSHTIFALPFALSMAVFLSRDYAISGTQLLCLVAAVVFARTSAMSFNRLVDRSIDARNPRTSGRELPSGKLTVASVALLFSGSTVGFITCAAALGMHCLIVSPLVLLVLLGYSLTKRFTSSAHFVLGIALACAPGGVWYAVTAHFAWLPVWMMLGVLMWVAGFDILYSLQDQQFDRVQGLFSIPARFGVKGAFTIARFTHLAAIFALAIFGIAGELGGAYWVALALFAGALLSQHLKISPDRLDAIESTFFTRNAWASIVYLLGMVIDRVVR